MKIKLTRNMHTLIDDSDYELVKDYKWRSHLEGSGKNYYSAVANIYIDKKRTTIRMSRLLMGLKKDNVLVVDHINGKPLDNRRLNLRVCTRKQNACNLKKSKRLTSSKYRGVWHDIKNNRWGAFLTSNNKTINLGYYCDEIEAAKVRDKAAKKYHGEFACLNFKQ